MILILLGVFLRGMLSPLFMRLRDGPSYTDSLVYFLILGRPFCRQAESSSAVCVFESYPRAVYVGILPFLIA